MLSFCLQWQLNHIQGCSLPKGLQKDFCQIKFPSRKCYNNTGADWNKEAVIKKGEMITTQQPITSRLFSKPLRCGETACGKFQGHLLCICHPFGTEKTSFQHCNLYLESTGCVSSFSVFLLCCSHLSANYSSILEYYANPIIYLFIHFLMFIYFFTVSLNALIPHRPTIYSR